MINSKELWINNKNGKLYEVLNYNILNCTNAQDNEKMYLYQVYNEKVFNENNEEILFVRSENEFKLKFTKKER